MNDSKTNKTSPNRPIPLVKLNSHIGEKLITIGWTLLVMIIVGIFTKL